MTAQEIQKRNGRAQKLRVIQVDDETFYVESSEGKICYRVTISDNEFSCSCGDFAKNQKDPKFRCKHLMAVLNCTTGDIHKAEILEKRKAKLDERFIKRIEGQDFVTYRGLLDLAHQKGLMKMEVVPVQYPSSENNQFAICKAIAESSTGEIFTDVGDANPGNTNSKVGKHLLRMASTRAKARALRDMTNIGMTCLEELDLADLMDNGSRQESNETPKKTPARKTPAKKVKSENAPKETSNKGNGPVKSRENILPKREQIPEPVQESTQQNLSGIPKMSEAQKRAVANLSRRRGISMEELERMVQESYQTSLEDLSSKDASQFIRQLQTAA